MLSVISEAEMKIELRIHVNCSEWDERVEADYDKEVDEMLYPEIE